MKVITNCYIVESITELFIKNHDYPRIMSAHIKSIPGLFVLIIKLISDAVK